MPSANIKTKSGTRITIEGDATDIAKIISQLEHAPLIHAAKQSRSVAKAKMREQKKQRTASDLIVGLKEEGFFDKSKTLKEIVSELETSGYLFPMTSLSGVMLALVQRRILTRAKRDKFWVYGKR